MEGKMKKKKEVLEMEVEYDQDDRVEHKRKNTEKDKSEKLHDGRKVNLYPDSHKGSAVVEVSLKQRFVKKIKSSSMLLIAKEIVGMSKDAENLKSRGHSRAEVSFRNGQEANDFVERILRNKSSVVEGYIPYCYTERKGIIKGLDIEHDIDDFMKHTIVPCKLLHVKRLFRKVVDKENNKVDWVPSNAIQITFEGNMLSEYIKVYGLYNMKVEVYVEPLKTCFNCCGYGHTSKVCKKEAICWTCGSKKHEDGEECPWQKSLICFHCQGEHKALNKQCYWYKFNQEVKEYMAYNAMSIFTALEAIRDKYNIKRDHHNTNKKISEVPNISKENFPKLVQTVFMPEE